MHRKKGVVYQVPCADCECVYMYRRDWKNTGEKKLKEHRGAVRRNDVTNGIAVQAWKTEPKVDWEAATVKQVETRAHYTRRGSSKPSTSRSRRLLPTLTVVNPSTQYGTPHLTPLNQGFFSIPLIYSHITSYKFILTSLITHCHPHRF